MAVSFEVSDGGEGWGDWKGGEFYDIVEDDFVCLGGFERCWSRSDTSKADGAATGALESSEGPDQPWAFVRCDNSGTFRSNQMADNAYPSKVFRLDSPAYPSSLGDWLWPPSCEVALGFAYMMYGADLGTLQVTVTGCWTYDRLMRANTPGRLWSVPEITFRQWEEAVVHLPPGTSYVSRRDDRLRRPPDFALDSIRTLDFHPTAPDGAQNPRQTRRSSRPCRPRSRRRPSSRRRRRLHQSRADADAVGGLAGDVPAPSSTMPADGGADVAEDSKKSSSSNSLLYIIIIVSAPPPLLCCCVALCGDGHGQYRNAPI